MPLTLAQAFQIGQTFPGVEVSTYFNSPALKVRGQMMACVPSHKSAEPDSLLIRVDRHDRAALLSEAPDLYYAPVHYTGFDGVLIRLSGCTPELAHDLMARAWNFTTRHPCKREPVAVASRPRRRRLPAAAAPRSPRPVRFLA